MGDYLAAHDKKHGLNRDDALATAFPSAQPGAEKSVLRFAAQFVGNVTRASVPLSKDDYLFSVRAVGKAGQRSLATYPLTLRNPLLPPVK